tara:strand:+ start:8891 stop:9796 length:906 start_codon:yes stop_codon:yes gene_type:complete
MTSLLQKVIHLVFGISDRLAPEFAGRLAFRLFSTTPTRRATSEKARQVLKDAQPAMAGARQFILAISRGAVSARYFAAPSGQGSELVLVTHGWGSRTEHMLPIIEALQRSGKAVVALDLPGHGQSTGRLLNMALAVEAVNAVWRQFGPISTMVGHSFGGAVLVNAAMGSVQGVPACKPDRLVLISAPNSLPAVFQWFADWLGLREQSRNALFRQVEQVTGRPLKDFVGTNMVNRLNIPTLVVHAREDREVSAANAEAFLTAGKHVELVWADGYGHRRILKAPEVVQAIVGFANRQYAEKAA